MIEYIKFLEDKHRATLNTLIVEGKTYRSRFVARENGYLAALKDIRDSLEQPAKDEELRRVMNKIRDSLS